MERAPRRWYITGKCAATPSLMSCKHECSAKDNALISASPAIFVPLIERGLPSPWIAASRLQLLSHTWRNAVAAWRSETLAVRLGWRASDAAVSFFLSSCEHMRALHLSGCVNLTDAFSRMFNLGCNLQSLSLSECTSITDIAVTKVARCCPRLTTINISGTRVTDLSVRALAEWCPALEKLNLGFTSVTDDGLRILALRCPSLSQLQLFCCHAVTDAALVVIAESCPALITLELRTCKEVTDVGVKAVASGCPLLCSLDLAYCFVTDAAIVAVALACPLLTELDLSGCDAVSDVGWSSVFEHCPLLHRVGLTYNISDKVMARLPTSRLKILSQEDGQRTTDTMASALVLRCPFLEHLNLNGCDLIGDASMVALARSEASSLLTYLNLAGCFRISDAALAGAVLQCPKLEHLSLCEQEVSGSTCQALGKTCPNLRDLSLRGCTSVTDGDVWKVLRGCEKLRLINLSGCPNITDRTCVSLGASTAELGHLDLSDCPAITDAIGHAMEQKRHLQVLLLGGCPNISDAPIVRISDTCPRLCRLSLSRCPKITDRAILALVDGCSLLHGLSLEGTAITDVAVLKLSRRFPNLAELDLMDCAHVSRRAVNLALQRCTLLERLDDDEQEESEGEKGEQEEEAELELVEEEPGEQEEICEEAYCVPCSDI